MPVTNYIWDVENDNVLMETDENDTTTAVYTNEPDEFRNLLSQRRGTASSYYHYDGIGSTRELTSTTENTTDTYIYTAFGEAVAITGTTINPFRYVGAFGYYHDPETADYYIRARTYRPAIARWTSLDPSQFIDGINRYVYVHNLPTSDLDPGGRLTIKPRRLKLRDVGCGKLAFIEWDFLLDTLVKPPRKKWGAPCDGFFIQKVHFHCDVVTCDHLHLTLVDISYWEAWPVTKGKRFTSIRKKFRVKYTDRAEFLVPDGTFGSCKQDGEVRFYCEEDIEKAGGVVLGTSIVGWHDPNCDPKTKSGTPINYGTGVCPISPACLESTETQPKFWGKAKITDGPAIRSFSGTWKCCCPPKTTSFTATPHKHKRSPKKV